jgi:hypothetical protein
MSTTDSIVDKIKKLLALADGNQNEHEREVAMQFAMDLLAKHNLTMLHVQSSMLDLKTDEVKADFKLEPWVRMVLKAACKLYYTEYYMTVSYNSRGQKERTPIFVGTQENIAVTIDMSAWLLDSIRLESNRLYKHNFERRSFRLGASHRILERAIEMLEAEKTVQATSTGTSLMVLRNQLERNNQEHLDKLKLNPFRGRSTYSDRGAYVDGQKYGGKVVLRQDGVKGPGLLRS